METSRKRIRRDFAPLTLSVAITCDSAYSPLMQVYDEKSGEYEPNRQLSPTVIRPIVNANAIDGSWPDHNANGLLANMKWYVNGVQLSNAGWRERIGSTGDYTIEESGKDRGSITIFRNIAPGSQVSLHFEAELVDNRLGVLIPVKTDSVILSATDKAEDGYSLSMGEDKNLRYSPFLDRLHLYDYKVAQGLIPASAQTRDEAMDGNQYLRTIPLKVYKGEEEITSGYTVKLYRVTNVNSMREVTSSDYEVVSVSASAIVLDLRLIEKADYAVKIFSDGEEVAREQFSVQRMYPSFRCEPTNETGIMPGQVERYDVAQVSCDGKVIECPGSILGIRWKTTTLDKADVEHNEGEVTVFPLAKTGVGNDYTNDWIDVATEAQQKPAYSVATDADGSIFTDESGNILIIN